MDMTQEVTQDGALPELRNPYLVGQAGVSLAVFHLARLRLEYAVTRANCPLGDVWVDVRGRKLSLEVKTSAEGEAWKIRLAQIGRTDIYSLVSLRTGVCYILWAAEMKPLAEAASAIYDGVANVTLAAIPDHARNAWARIKSYTDRPVVDPKTKKFGIDMRVQRDVPVRYKSTRTVKRRLANGEIKVYVYPPMCGPT